MTKTQIAWKDMELKTIRMIHKQDRIGRALCMIGLEGACHVLRDWEWRYVNCQKCFELGKVAGLRAIVRL